MKVVCINKIKYYPGSYSFTKGKTYNVRPSNSRPDIFLIMDNYDHNFWFVPDLSDNFIELDKYRKQKLEKLNEKTNY